MPQMRLLPSQPPTRVVDRIREALELPRKSVESLNAWFKRNMQLVASLDFQEIAYQASTQTGLDQGDVAPLLSVVLQVGVLVENESQLEDAVTDLKTLGLADAQLENFRTLMGGIRFSESKLLREISFATSTAIPTVADINVVCDLRAVFEDQSTTAEGDRSRSRLKALVPVAILSLDISDDSGDTKSVVVQLPETVLTRLQRQLSQAAGQLAQLGEIGRKVAAPSVKD